MNYIFIRFKALFEFTSNEMHFRINFPPSFQYSMVLILLFAVRGYSDPPITDVVEVLYKGNKYYIAECFVDYGTLKNHDLCYYDASGEYLAEVFDIVNNFEQPNGSITLYITMQKVNVHQFECYPKNKDQASFDSVLKIFKNKVTVPFKDFHNNFKVLDAYHGNQGIFRYTRSLKEADNAWIDKNKIERLFCVKGHEICTYGFFAIKGKISKAVKDKLEKRIKALMKDDNSEIQFYEMLEELYRKKIVMVGHCSC